MRLVNLMPNPLFSPNGRQPDSKMRCTLAWNTGKLVLTTQTGANWTYAHRRRLLGDNAEGPDGTDETGLRRGHRLHGHRRAARESGVRHAARLGHDPVGRHVAGGEDQQGRWAQYLLPARWQHDVEAMAVYEADEWPTVQQLLPPISMVQRRNDAPAVIGGERR